MCICVHVCVCVCWFSIPRLHHTIISTSLQCYEYSNTAEISRHWKTARDPVESMPYACTVHLSTQHSLLSARKYPISYKENKDVGVACKKDAIR